MFAFRPAPQWYGWYVYHYPIRSGRRDTQLPKLAHQGIVFAAIGNRDFVLGELVLAGRAAA
jgi:hypothetical protein